jgi:hypothetical protein
VVLRLQLLLQLLAVVRQLLLLLRRRRRMSQQKRVTEIWVSAKLYAIMDPENLSRARIMILFTIKNK